MTTDDIRKFERFWVEVLGFERVMMRPATTDNLCEALFSNKGDLTLSVYQHPKAMAPTLMVTRLHQDSASHGRYQALDGLGMNYLTLNVGKKGSLQSFLDDLPESVKVHRGAHATFIQDYEGNIIELQEDR